ncbi:MAG: alpha-L-fucosidase [Candidatus Symbiothrix sp.]|jgi:alpha-L-fucosidase|nr:alpha-L-fucosidase [Candidatus Symbiothrix sp.]
MKNSSIKLLALFVLFSVPVNLFAQTDKMDWWREARFGMFIHWGVYAVYGNMYDGVDINGQQVHYDDRGSGLPSEWIMNSVKIPRSVYREAAKEFDAKEYDPKKWVEIAKNAGMKYIVITAKHHDGFCLFETKHTDWNALDASAAKRDLLKDLVQEAKNAGLKIGFYYSQNRDWMHEGGMGEVPELNGGQYPLNKVETYVNTIVIPHIQELTSKYDIDLFWFDGPNMPNSNAVISKKIQDALLNSPLGNKIIYNDRLFNGFPGDFSTPETDTPTIPYNGYENDRDWEACASLSNSWGYEYDIFETWRTNGWKSAVYTISRILELAGKGGNFLLNVGPDKHGNIPEPALNTLAEVGEWMKIYGETVYGSRKNNLLNPFEYGYITQKEEKDKSIHWYLHVSAGYWAEKEIVLNGVNELPVSATLFDSKEPVEIKLENNHLILSLPDHCPNPYYSTIDLHFQQLPVQPVKYPLRNNTVRLTPFQATVSSMKKDYIPYAFKNWYSKNAEIQFETYLESGEYMIEAEYAAWYEDGELYFKVDDKEYTGYYKNTGDPKKPNDLNHYITDNLGGVKINIPVSKKQAITIKRNAGIPNLTNWIDVRSFTLKKIAGTDIPDSTVLIYPTLIKTGYFICESPYEQTIRIYDLLGRCCKTSIIEGYTRVDIPELKSGVYIIKGDKFTHRIIVP